ncbi:acyl-CoA dehydrogenase family protein [Rummeliibacillus suwonensis]|uniref:acyl-CoA dehydrogenase family protein n=1 Tax=Rummeliibacillus suwonensis TaxID=1306154 RepID=UPI001AAE7DDF|nr:acyl-CoA dehydrogenase family protein [Rummeliibacillus suwonensis]MBO2537610.1 acyl-CoA/acyl-ACP dehydrogenase [Rummeliibacillus suwonensis]
MNNSNQTIRNERDARLVEYAERIAKQLSETASDYDEKGEFPFEHFKILEKEGYFKLTIPKEYGGEDLSLYEVLLVQERIAKASGSTALAVGWHLMTFFSLNDFRPWKKETFARICKEAVEEGSLLNVYITERATGNIIRGGNPGTIAKKTEGGYIITGRKAFTTLAPYVKHFTVLAYIEEEDITAEFLIEKNESVELIDTWNVLGMRGTGSIDIALHDVFVPDEALLAYSEKGKPTRFNGNSSAYTLQLPAIYLGIATAARDFIIKYADEKYSPSLGNVILEAPHVQQKIGEIEILIAVSRTLLYSIAEKWDNNEHLRDKLRNEVAITKYTVCNNAVKIVELANQIAGGHSLSKDLPLERYFRDVQCGLYNPPLNDMVVSLVSNSAIESYRNNKKTHQLN